MDHHAVTDIETHMVGLPAAKAPIEGEVAGFELVERNAFDGCPLGARVVGEFNAELGPDPLGEA